ncbi:MAG: formyltransferase family protein, partial [Gemmatimonadales bacterium]
RRVHEAVVESGARVSGATVHFVDEIYDHGAIIAQWPVPVLAGDDADALATRVLAVEHRLLPAVVEAYAEGRFALSTAGRVAWQGSWYPDDEFTMVSSKTTD